jgi:hypothetical protein
MSLILCEALTKPAQVVLELPALVLYQWCRKWNFRAATGSVVVWSAVAQQLRDKNHRTAGDIVHYSNTLPFGWLLTRCSKYKHKAIGFYNAHLQVVK